MSQTIVLGAGMAGCLYGAINNKSIIYEAQKTIPDNHQAVLRFREDKISKTTGITFRKVKVTKAIWYNGKEHKPSPRLSNWYSSKVTGEILERSIDNTQDSYRYIAPKDFHMILADMCGNRIILNHPISFITKEKISFSCSEINEYTRKNEQIISTLPMPILSKIINKPINETFSHKKIFVTRYKIHDCDVFQTIYYPDPHMKIYRATLTGGELIVESTDDISLGSGEISQVIDSFGIQSFSYQALSETEQKYGKILPIDDGIRKQFQFDATHKFNIYSLGRFATWRNLLLDDVYDDIFRIKRMSNGDFYNLRKEML